MIYHRWSPTLGALESTPEKIWGTRAYDPEKHNEKPTVFCGLYGLPDFYALWRHKGKRYVWWTGTDITHFLNGYWLEDGGGIRLDPKALAKWINKHCESWVENIAERDALAKLGIISDVCPSFLGDIKAIKTFFRPSNIPKIYASVSGDDFNLYNWHQIERIAGKCNAEFHLYGNRTKWNTKHKNVIVHGRVPKEQMNREIAEMQCALRPLPMDGFSEVLAKAVLMGQYAISHIEYPHIIQAKTDSEMIAAINSIGKKRDPNYKALRYYSTHLNKYPWNQK